MKDLVITGPYFDMGLRGLGLGLREGVREFESIITADKSSAESEVAPNLNSFLDLIPDNPKW